MFITMEGIEGSGKTTQMRLLSEWLLSQQIDCVLTKEPGGTEVGQHIRELVLNPKTVLTHPYSETLLFIADRVEHIAQVIQPALDAQKWVLSDRYSDSTLAYQVGGRQLDRTMVTDLDKVVVLKPDITLVLDLPVEEGLKRAKKRAALDRFEQETRDFHHRVRAIFLDQAQKEPKRVKVIDVLNLTPDEVFKKIKEILIPYLKS